MSQTNDTKKLKSIISALRKENRILRAELKRLQRSQSVTSGSVYSAKSSDTERAFSMCYRECRMLSSTSYIKYLFKRITAASMYNIIKRISGYFRKFRLISTVFKITSSVLAIIGTGAFFIFISGILIFLIPFVLAFFALAYLFAMLYRKRAFRSISAVCENADIYVFFPPKGRAFEKDSYFKKTVNIISKSTERQNFILIVSPYFTISKGYDDAKRSRYYPVARFDAENVCIIRRHSYFALRRRVLLLHSGFIAYIH